MSAFEILQETPTGDASRVLQTRLAHMVKWQSRTLTGVSVLLFLSVTGVAIRRLREENASIENHFGLVIIGVHLAAACVLFATAVAGVILVCRIFQVGYAAFGIWSAFVYVVLTVMLTFCLIWPALFVIPQMVRLDVKRSWGVDLDMDQAI